MGDIVTWPTTPACSIATWQCPSDTVRLTLPVDLEPGSDLGIGAVGPGWLELSDDPDAPRLPVRTRVQSRNRIVFAGNGAVARFAAADGDEVLIRVTGAPRRRLLQVTALDCLEHALREPTLRPARLYRADGWNRWRRDALDPVTTMG
jgi:hypothetical protein